ncbi:FAD-dependent thymidylate synthase [Candidatus Micrarchaeota archaeon]|nr:FAD-dependent thymidylate synthase [Candidatus Micrarchaeota archaeon]
MEYSKTEQEILLHFFTNLDKRVFIAKNIHPEIWALLQAQYSRSKEGLRERFLKTLKNDKESYKKLVEAVETKELDNIALIKAEEKAQNFLSEWGLKYGHGSIIEGAIVGIGVEDISIFEAKTIEDNRLSSFTEKSTRYVDFGLKQFHIPKEIRGTEVEKEYLEIMNYLFDTYTILNSIVLSDIQDKIPFDIIKHGDKKVWERSCRSRCFDSTRYILPVGAKTSLGWTVNARELEHAIVKMLSHPWKVIRDLGEELKEEAKKILKSSLEFANECDYLIETNKIMPDVINGFLKAHGVKELEYEIEDRVTLVNTTADPENFMIASVINSYSELSFENSFKLSRDLTPEKKEEIFDNFMNKMGNFDAPLRQLENVYFTFDIVMDYGAWRDLQRQRMCTQTVPHPTNGYGFEIPEDIDSTKSIDMYTNAVELANNFSNKIKKDYPETAAMVLPLGNNIRYSVTMNIREVYYMCKLRTSPQSHYSYRNVVLDMYDIMKNKYPLLMKYAKIRFDGEALGRLRQEQQAQKPKM